MKTQGGTFENLGLHASRALAKLTDWLAEDGIVDLVGALGLSLPDTSAASQLRTVASELAAAAAALHAPEASLTAALETDPPNRTEVAEASADLFSAIEEVLATIEPLRQAVAQLEGIPQDALADFSARFAKRLVDFVAITHIEVERPFLLRVLVALGVVELEQVGTDAAQFRPRHIRRSINLDRLKLLFDPSSHPAEALYRWGHDDLRAEELLEIVSQCALSVGIPAFYAKPADGEARIDLGALQLSHRPDLSPAGFAVQMDAEDFGPQVFEFPLGPSLKAMLEIGAAVHRPPAVLIEPGLPPQLQNPEAIEEGRIAFRISASSDAPGRKLLLLGESDGTRLEADSLNWQGELRVEPGERGVFLSPSLLAQVAGGTITIGLGEADSFLRALLADDPRINFDFGFAWDRGSGLHLAEGVGLSMVVPVRKQLGPFSLDALHLEVAAVETGIQLDLSTVVGGAIGPIAFSVDRVGGRISFQTNGDDTRPLRIESGYRPPNGLSVGIDAGVVAGEGFLHFDRNRAEYCGPLQLEAAGVRMSAIGALTTRVRDSLEDYSFLAIVSAEILPTLQLGYGFGLTRVGGLLGIHRSLRMEELRAGLQTGALDTVLYPADPLGNAPQILRDLTPFFTPSPVRHVLGLVLELVWGTPRHVVKSRLALLVELPDPARVALLGRVQVCLPDQTQPSARINLDAAGTLEPERRRATLEATLQDSNLAGFPLTGDMAMRVRYGDRPQFALAIGGFHPAFQPPPGFPALRRATIAISAESNPRLRLEAYLALTSNTVQVGARVEIRAGEAGFRIAGTLGFDGLLRFGPFQFSVSASGRVALKRGSRNLMGLTLNMNLSGIAPWRVRGGFIFEILLYKGLICFDRTFGGASQPVVVNVQVAPLIKEALESSESWSAELPKASAPMVSLAATGSDKPRQVWIHPWCTPTVRQKVAPLGIRIDRLGQARPIDGDQFELAPEAFLGEGEERRPVRTEPVMDYFAAAQFQDRSDSDKLSHPSFESMQTGVALAVDFLTAGTARSRTVDYNETLFDLKRRRSFPMAHLGVAIGITQDEFRNAARSASRHSELSPGGMKFRAESIHVEVMEPEFALTDLDSIQSGAQPRFQASHSALPVKSGRTGDQVVERSETVTGETNWYQP